MSDDQHIRVCGVSENLLELARTGRYRWNKRELTYCIVDRVPGIPAADFADVIAESFKAWAAVCDRVFTAVLDPRLADFLTLARRIDGRNGVLAEHQLPPGNDMQLRGWLDVGEQWTLAMLLAVWTHELGHGLGLSHTDTPNSLMNPFYNPRIQKPQQWDIQAVQGLYGKPRPADAPPAPPVPAPPTAPESFVGMMEFNGAVYDVKGTRRL